MPTALQPLTIIQLPSATRSATLTLTKTDQAPVDLEARTAVFSFSSEQPVERFDWEEWKVFDEVLSHDPDHVNLKRVALKACPLLWNHDRSDQRGIVEEAWIESDRRAYCKVRFSKSAEGERLMQDAADGIVTSASFMYQVYELSLTKKAEPKNTYTATSWEVLEVSLVSIPADASVGVSRHQTETQHNVTVKALPAELKVGDWVGWHAATGTSKGRIDTIATDGSVQPTTGSALAGTPDNPAYLITLWAEQADGWQATETKVAKRASALTEIASLKKAASGGQRSTGKQQRKPKEQTVGKRSKIKITIQQRELTLADYLTVDNPALSDVTSAFEATLTAIDDAASTDDTLDTTALYQSAIDAMCDQLYSVYEIPDPDAAEDTAETPMMTGEKTVEPEKPTAQETERDREYKALQQKVQLMERREHITRKFTTLRQQAEALKTAGKLTPAEFKDKFGDVDAAIDLYTKADDSKINSLAERLTDIEKYATPVEFGSKLKHEPLEVPETRSAYDAELESYQASKGKGKR